MKTAGTIMEHISGLSLSESDFIVHSTRRRLPPELMESLFRGRIPGIHVAEYLDRNTCETIASNFFTNPGKKSRSDSVPGQVVGADSFGRDMERYLDDVERSRDHVNALFTGIEDPVQRVLSEMRLSLSSAPMFRLAESHGRAAGVARAVRWDNGGTFALRPHDDLAQLRHPGVVHSELGHVSSPIAINIYPMMCTGGSLVVFNIAPDQSAWNRFGVAGVGYPYPIEALADVKRVRVTLADGDLLLLNGRFVHAVESCQSDRPRVLVNCFAGMISDNLVVTWT